MTSNPIAEGKRPMTTGTVQMLFIDHQPEIIGSCKTNPTGTLTAAAVGFAKLGRMFDIPVAVSCVPIGADRPKLIPELESVLADAPRFPRTQALVFADAATAR